ncbi:MAG: 30S ribosomal protein S7 [Planctomycetaceae bacterium]|nr:MAG: 30S ribosomal protein S7 [Planctomycetaceae bacterium]
MTKRMTASAEQLRPDPRYNSKLVSKFINCLMHCGKKSIAMSVFYAAMDIIKEKNPDRSELEIFETAVNNCRPTIEVRSRRVGGANYQVPVPVKDKRQVTLAIRWIIQACRAKKGRPMHRKLAEELMAAYNRQGAAITTRENVHRMAEANKAFAHFGNW